MFVIGVGQPQLIARPKVICLLACRTIELSKLSPDYFHPTFILPFAEGFEAFEICL